MTDPTPAVPEPATETRDTLAAVLAHIRDRQAQPGGTGNPEGPTEMHSYHVWEVLNALSEMQP